MKNKINVVDILKNCPQGMKLDSPAYNNLYFDTIIDSDDYPIKCYTTNNGMLNTVFFTKYGEIRREKNAKCVIFPKGKDNWGLVHDKFDISTLKPFESKVLVRDFDNQIWKPAIFGCYIDNKHYYVTVGGISFIQLIPYENNEYLMGTTDDCDEFYKNWEK